MAEPFDNPVPGPNLQGLKYLDKLLPLFDRLHDVGCRRDKAGNRKLHFDHYCALILLFLLVDPLLEHRDVPLVFSPLSGPCFSTGHNRCA